jgi:hypothetical protein
MTLLFLLFLFAIPMLLLASWQRESLSVLRSKKILANFAVSLSIVSISVSSNAMPCYAKGVSKAIFLEAANMGVGLDQRDRGAYQDIEKSLSARAPAPALSGVRMKNNFGYDAKAKPSAAAPATEAKLSLAEQLRAYGGSGEDKKDNNNSLKKQLEQLSGY